MKKHIKKFQEGRKLMWKGDRAPLKLKKNILPYLLLDMQTTF